MSHTTAEAPPHLDLAKVLRLLGEDGPISSRLKNFEIRKEQQEMLTKLVEAFNNSSIALIEAGTGTGKSMAYLIPAILVAAIWKERVVISTHTISLQEQLLYKDLPLLIDSLGIELKVVLVKGMGNYVCLRKLDEIEFEKRLLNLEDQEKVAELESYCKKGVGAKTDFPTHPPTAIWDLVGAEYDSCNTQECRHYSECFYINARKNAQDAQILIVNHHLLLADLSIRSEPGVNGPLPSFQHLIIDEAHHLEEIATEHFALQISRLEMLKTMGKISSEKQGKVGGKLAQIKEKVQKNVQGDFSKEISDLLHRLTLELPHLKRDLLKELAQFFHLLEQFQNQQKMTDDPIEEQKLRLREMHFQHTFWQGQITPSVIQLAALLKRYAFELERLESLMQNLDNQRLLESSKGLLFDLKALSKRVEKYAEKLTLFCQTTPTLEQIRWLETSLTRTGLNLSCVEASLNVSELLLKHLFTPLKTVALLSATLTTKQSFKYIRERLGLQKSQLDNREVIEARYESPFNYEKQSLFLIPKDLPDPNSVDFLRKAEPLILEALRASRGNAFLLFTSYSMLQQCYRNIKEILKEENFHALKQGDKPRTQLIQQFTEKDRSVLFGTDSFWEGVDVAGEALRLVIIIKLPFKVPTEPLLQARSEALKAEGKDPFTELILPQSAIKLKQGFGRLIRNKNDRGCILCLDHRLISKSYGQYFLKTLPECPKMIIESKECKSVLEEFYRKTYYITKNGS